MDSYYQIRIKMLEYEFNIPIFFDNVKEAIEIANKINEAYNVKTEVGHVMYDIISRRLENV